MLTNEEVQVLRKAEQGAAEQEKLNAFLADYAAQVRSVDSDEANQGAIEPLGERYRLAVLTHGAARINALLDELIKRETPALT